MTAGREGAGRWLPDATARLLAVVDGLDDAALDLPTALPGWSRRHLLAHLGWNAEALRRLLRWARTGERTPMYASPEQRNAEIAEAAQWEPARLRDLVAGTARALADDVAALPPEAWSAEVVTAQGRTVPAAEVPWMRVREVAVHAVDLDAGTGFEDLPADLCAALVDDVAALRSRRADGPALVLRADGGQEWLVDGHGTPAVVTGTPAALARWVTGRGSSGLGGDAGGPPALGPWL